MPLRLSGLSSGLDTDTVIKELMTAQSLKKTKIEQKRTKLEWKQEKWKDLNAKIYKLYTDQISKLRMQGGYQTKKVSSSDETKLTATAGANASSGSHVVEVSHLASAQYTTSASLKGKNASASTKLEELGMARGTIITVKSGKGDSAITKTLEIKEDTTINDFVETMKSAGLTASFDANQGRFFISSATSGADQVFSITTSKITDTALGDARKDLEAALGDNASKVGAFYDNYSLALKTLEEKQKAYDDAASGTDEKLSTWEELQKAKKAVTSLEDGLVNLATDAKTAELTEKYTKEVINERKNWILANKDGTYKNEYDKIVDNVKSSFYELDADGKPTNVISQDGKDQAKAVLMQKATDTINEQIKNGAVFADEDARQAAIQAEYTNLVGADEDAGLINAITKPGGLYESALNTAIENDAKSYAGSAEGQQEIKDRVNGDQALIDQVGATVKNAINAYHTALDTANGTGGGVSAVTGELAKLGLTEIVDGNVIGAPPVVSDPMDGFKNIEAADAVITLDGVTMKGTSNSFTVNGITLDLKATTTQPITINVTNDTQAVFDSVKTFVKEYNALLTEMNELYYASTAKGYEPLTEEEKAAMSDKQVEMWENKIKDSLLRRDDTLSSVMSAMKTTLQTSVEVDGKKYSLSSFGITTGDYTEKGLLHIYGDSEDSTYADRTNLLMNALNEDPDLVAKVLSGVANNLYTTMQDKMKATTLSSALTFYNDKDMAKQVTEYNKQIKNWEKKLTTMETKYYKQFSAMETAMAKLNSQSSYISGFFG